MNDLAPLSTPEPSDETGQSPRTGFHLVRLEVLNWGTFDKKVYGMDLKGDNALLTGDIGSGKSTLVDAVTTLLVPHQRINYNKAAGAEARERDLRSYVLGYYTSRKGEEGNTAKPVGLRDHNSYSVILCHFRNDGLDHDVSVAQVFWMKDQGQPDRFFTVADRVLSIAGDFGSVTDIAGLKKRLKADPRIEVHETFPPYGAAFRRRFGIETEQALDLFLQTVSMKSVGNLTDFVRSHMLDSFDAKNRIRDLVAHYDDLVRAHEAVLKAKRQIAALTPIVADCDRHGVLAAEVADMRECRDMLSPWFAGLKADLLEDRLATLKRNVASLAEQVSALTEERKRLDKQHQNVVTDIALNGGDRLEKLRDDIGKAEDERDNRKRRAGEYAEVAAKLGFPAVSDAESFLDNQRRLESERTLADTRQAEAQNERVEAEVRFRELRAKHESDSAELASLRRRPSNIPKQMLDLRDDLGRATGIGLEDLPFVGELIQVRPEARAAWEGAAERLLHGFALSLLVPDAHYAQVADWVDRTPLGRRLVYFRVRDQKATSRPSLSAASLVHKLQIKEDSGFYGWLEGELARRFDYVCCDSLDQFRREPKAVTRAGQFKGGNERHEKDDRRAIDDRTTFVLGWSNAAKIAALEQRVDGLETQMGTAAEAIGTAKAKESKQSDRLQTLVKLEAWTSFRDIDWKSAAADAERLTREKREIEAASDVLGKLEEQRERLAGELERAGTKLIEASNRHTLAEQAVTDTVRTLVDAQAELAAAPDERRQRYFPLLADLRPQALGDRKLSVDSCDKAEKDMRDWLQSRIDNAAGRLNDLGQKIVKAMTSYMEHYPLETREVDASLAAAAEYRKMLQDLETDGLPGFERRFKEQLNENAIREIANFQSQLNRESGEIEERIALINRSLERIDYNKGRFIRLETERTIDPDIRDFRQDLRTCTEGALTGSDDDAYSEAKFLQVKAIVERFRGRDGLTTLDASWTAKVTDVRNWFVFSASERWREDDSEFEHFTDSVGKSGGQKEKLAYTVLAAGLAYQFGLDWTGSPSRSFRFVMIDEAFGRGSDDSARYGLALFRNLGLQLLIVTPLQKVHVIEPFVSAVGFVYNPTGSRSELRTLTIEEYRAEREARRGQ